MPDVEPKKIIDVHLQELPLIPHVVKSTVSSLPQVIAAHNALVAAHNSLLDVLAGWGFIRTT